MGHKPRKPGNPAQPQAQRENGPLRPDLAGFLGCFSGRGRVFCRVSVDNSQRAALRWTMRPLFGEGARMRETVEALRVGEQIHASVALSTRAGTRSRPTL